MQVFQSEYYLPLLNSQKTRFVKDEVILSQIEAIRWFTRRVKTRKTYEALADIYDATDDDVKNGIRAVRTFITRLTTEFKEKYLVELVPPTSDDIWFNYLCIIHQVVLRNQVDSQSVKIHLN